MNNTNDALRTLQDSLALAGPDTTLSIQAEGWFLHALGSRFTGTSEDLGKLLDHLSQVARFEVVS